MDNWLIIGATSGMGRYLARELASRGHRLALAARNSELLERTAKDIEIRHQRPVHTITFDALEFDSHPGFVETVESEFGPVYGVVYAIGAMAGQEKLQSDLSAMRRELDVNYTGAVSVLELFAGRMENRRSGHIVAFGSPAGDRGRKSNYLYGASKAALHIFLQGLRQRLAPAGIHVTTVKPGPTRTPMTAGMKKLPLLAEPKDQARNIARAIERGTEVVYTPWPWRLIITAIRHIPQRLFKRLSL